MIESTALKDIKRAIVEEARSDVVGLWAILWEVRQRMPSINTQQAQAATLAVVAEALEEQAVVAGDFVDKHQEAAVFVPWSLATQAAISRIRNDWDALGRDPNLGDIVCFVDPRILPISASKDPMGRGWRPKPA